MNADKMKPDYLSGTLNISTTPDYYWPPSWGYCPKCQAAAPLIGHSYGRYYYSCDRRGCPHYSVENVLIFSRLPGNIGRCKWGWELHQAIPSILSEIVFLEGDHEVIPVMFRCGTCRVAKTGMWSPDATAGFVTPRYQITLAHDEDGPNYGVSLLCDECLGIAPN